MVYGGWKYDPVHGLQDIPVHPTKKSARRPQGVPITDHDLTQAGRIDSLSRASDTELGHRQADEIL